MAKTPAHESVQQLTGRLVALRKWQPEADSTPLEQALAACRIRTYAAKILEDAPALTTEQIAAIADTLKGGA